MGRKWIQFLTCLATRKRHDLCSGLGVVPFQDFLEKLIVEHLWRMPLGLTNAVVKLQTGRGKDGITDTEIDIDSDVALIIEAKKGPNFHSRSNWQNMPMS